MVWLCSARYGHWHKDKTQQNVKSLPRMFVFIMGGACYSELRTAYEVTAANKNWEVIIGKSSLSLSLSLSFFFFSFFCDSVSLYLVRISLPGSINDVYMCVWQVRPTSCHRKASSTIWKCWAREINRYQRERHHVAKWFSDGSTPLSITPFRVSICSILMLYCYLFMVSARHYSLFLLL